MIEWTQLLQTSSWARSSAWLSCGRACRTVRNVRAQPPSGAFHSGVDWVADLVYFGRRCQRPFVELLPGQRGNLTFPHNPGVCGPRAHRGKTAVQERIGKCGRSLLIACMEAVGGAAVHPHVRLHHARSKWRGGLNRGKVGATAIPRTIMHCSPRVRRYMHITKDLVAASATPLVLGILAEGESYGYAILKQVNELSGGQLEWTDGLLYPLLHRLERLGHVESAWETPPGDAAASTTASPTRAGPSSPSSAANGPRSSMPCGASGARHSR